MRLAVYLAMSESLSMVCTMGCVHTRLRDGESHIKMGSPCAYVDSNALHRNEKPRFANQRAEQTVGVRLHKLPRQVGSPFLRTGAMRRYPPCHYEHTER